MPISWIYSSQEKKQPSWDLSDVQRFALNEPLFVENDAFASRRLHHDVAVVDAPVGAPEKDVVAIQTNNFRSIASGRTLKEIDSISGTNLERRLQRNPKNVFQLWATFRAETFLGETFSVS